MSDVYVDFEGVETCISQVKTQIENLKNAADGISTTVETNLGECWRGKSHDKCVSTYESEYKNLLTNQVPDLVKQLEEFIQVCRDRLKEADEELGKH